MRCVRCQQWDRLCRVAESQKFIYFNAQSSRRKWSSLHGHWLRCACAIPIGHRISALLAVAFAYKIHNSNSHSITAIWIRIFVALSLEWSGGSCRISFNSLRSISQRKAFNYPRRNLWQLMTVLPICDILCATRSDATHPSAQVSNYRHVTLLNFYVYVHALFVPVFTIPAPAKILSNPP